VPHHVYEVVTHRLPPQPNTVTIMTLWSLWFHIMRAALYENILMSSTKPELVRTTQSQSRVTCTENNEF